MPTALRPLRLRSSRAHSDLKPAVEAQRCPLRAEVGEEIGDELARPKPAVEVQQCPLRTEVGEEIGDKLARRKWTWKLMQTLLITQPPPTEFFYDDVHPASGPRSSR